MQINHGFSYAPNHKFFNQISEIYLQKNKIVSFGPKGPVSVRIMKTAQWTGPKSQTKLNIL